MHIAPLQQALCADRSRVTAGPDPGCWLTPSLPAGWRLLGFHFFVDWRQTPPVVAERIWMTRQLRLDAAQNLQAVSDADILRLFRADPASSEFADLERVCALYGNQVSAIVLADIPVAEITDETPLWVIARPQAAELGIRRVPVRRLKEAIQEHSGGPVHVGSKGLTYGTSAVECYLSGSDAAFPGDADAVIVDERNRVRCVVEYKKHTLSAPIDQHLVTDYYPRPDGRKYQRLAALAARYQRCLQQPVPLVVLYYSTKSPVIRLQEIGSLDANSVTISRDSGDLSTCGRLPNAISDDVMRWLGMYS